MADSPIESVPQAPRASRTAVITSLMRALHTRFDRPALIQDDWGDRLATGEEKRALASWALGVDPAGADSASDGRAKMPNAGSPELILYTAWRDLGVYGGVVIRSRYTEDRVAEAVARGVRQYVLIGAGLDSFALRRPGFARDLAIYEVDHPASQEDKRRRIEASGAAIPAGAVHFVAADLAAVSLEEALRGAGFRMDEPAIFSWLGVTVYLTREANFATLRSVGRFAKGSELVFTYLEQRMLDSDSPAMRRARAGAAALGEPWIGGFDLATLPGDLRALNLELIEDLGHEEMTARYCAGRSDALTPGRAGRICTVRVV